MAQTISNASKHENYFTHPPFLSQNIIDERRRVQFVAALVVTGSRRE